MLGFAVIDAPANADRTIWLVSRVGVGSSQVENTNAVVIAADDPRRAERTRALVFDRQIVVTDATGALPNAWHLRDVEALQRATAASHAAIRTSVEAPTVRPYVTPDADTGVVRALALANFVKGAWANWLALTSSPPSRTRIPYARA